MFTQNLNILIENLEKFDLTIYNKRNPMGDNQERLLEDRYYLTQGDIKETSWNQVSNRVAIFIALGIYHKYVNGGFSNYTDEDDTILVLVKKLHKVFYELILNRVFMPNTPTLFNAGIGLLDLTSEEGSCLLHTHYEDILSTDYVVLYDAWKKRNPETMLSACFTIPTEDDIDDIFNSSKKLAKIAKAGGGIGINLSKLRPKNSKVGNTGGVASGAVSFLSIFNTAGDIIKQGGKRRAAIMGLLNYDHPDIMEFINCKSTEESANKLSTMNISVNFSDHEKFLNAYRNNETYKAKHNFEDTEVDINARELLHTMAVNSHKTGDPGFIMLGKHNEKYSLSNIEPIDLVNPCGEEPLRPYSSCTLGHLNLAAITIITEEYHNNIFDMNNLKEFFTLMDTITRLGVIFLNLVNVMNKFPIPEIREEVNFVNPIGLGYLGLGELFYRFGIKYGSDESLDITALLTGEMAINSYTESVNYARYIGKFPYYAASRFLHKEFRPVTYYEPKIDKYDSVFYELNKNWESLFKLLYDGEVSLANSQINTIAPTGSTGTLAGTTTGIEPSFSMYTKRTVTAKDNKEIILYSFNNVLKERLTPKEIDEIKEGGSISEVTGKDFYVCASDISTEGHLKVQEAAQYYVDASISKTINVPKETTVKQIEDIYLRALESPVLKGITVYRDGSRSKQVLEKASKPKITKRPQKVGAVCAEFENEKGKTYIFLSYTKHKVPFDLFIQDGREKAEIIGRLASKMLRQGNDIFMIIEQLKRVSSGDYSNEIAFHIETLVDADGLVKLNFDPIEGENDNIIDVENPCPNCGAELVKMEGCTSCINCGYSACS